MAPRRHEYSIDMRQKVIQTFLKGDSQRQIATDMLLPRTSVQKMIKKYKATKCLSNLAGRGRKRKTTIRVDRLIERKLKCGRRKPARIVKTELEQELGVHISERTIKRRANEYGLFGRVARKRPYVNKRNRLKRLKFAKTMSAKPLNFWDTILWSDESKFNLFGSDGKVMVWRSKKEEFDPKCTVPTVKYGGGSVTVWGCFCRSGVGNLVFLDRNMDMHYYVDILDKNLIQSAKHLRLG
ncbi:unnamed protein product, partial [Rotaria sp. Silwood2]